MINEIYDNGEIPEDIQSRTKECEFLQTINFMKHITKTVINRARNRINPEIEQKQCDTRTEKVLIFMI